MIITTFDLFSSEIGIVVADVFKSPLNNTYIASILNLSYIKYNNTDTKLIQDKDNCIELYTNKMNFVDKIHSYLSDNDPIYPKNMLLITKLTIWLSEILNKQYYITDLILNGKLIDINSMIPNGLPITDSLKYTDSIFMKNTNACIRSELIKQFHMEYETLLECDYSIISALSILSIFIDLLNAEKVNLLDIL